MVGKVFSYNKKLKEEKLYVSISSAIQYNFKFLDEVTKLMSEVENSKCDKIYFFSEEDDIHFDKLGSAYLFNTLIFFSKNKCVLVDKSLYKIFHDQVSHYDGAKFERIDLVEVSKSKIQQCYTISDDKAVNQTVQILVDFIAENNLVLENAKEFLVTTIGEIFANAFGHSDEKKVSFMYDIEWYNEKFYLVINITDYGKTIIHNVQSFQREYYDREMNSCDCINWAMKIGNTTRCGSGGYGLPTLVDYVSNVEGELLIFSGNSVYALKGTVENILKAKGNFYGTSISMKIPLFDTSKAILYDEKRNKIVSMDLDKI